MNLNVENVQIENLHLCCGSQINSKEISDHGFDTVGPLHNAVVYQTVTETIQLARQNVRRPKREEVEKILSGVMQKFGMPESTPTILSDEQRQRAWPYSDLLEMLRKRTGDTILFQPDLLDHYQKTTPNLEQKEDRSIFSGAASIALHGATFYGRKNMTRMLKDWEVEKPEEIVAKIDLGAVLEVDVTTYITSGQDLKETFKASAFELVEQLAEELF